MAGAAVVALGVVAVPATASATTLWVSPSTPSAPYNSCSHPGYDHIQEAINGPGTKIHVCGGHYAEQLTIERTVSITGYEGATVEISTDPTTSSTPCDAASQAASGLPDEDAISVCGGNATIKDLNVNAVWPGAPVGPSESCAYILNGILVAGDGNLKLSDSKVVGARPQVINGCQYGIGVQVGMSYTASEGVGTATLSGDEVSGYQKNGITVEGTGSSASISKTTVTGAGKVTPIAQNGIGVQEGAKGTLKKVTVSGDECENATCGPDALTSYQSVGVYFYEAGAGSSVTSSKITDSDIGSEAYDQSGTPTISKDKFEGDRWESVVISQGSAAVSNDLMKGGNIGIELLQFVSGPFGETQAVGPTGSGSHDTIEGMSQWAVLGRSDKDPADLPGEFSITNSKISGNPGSRPLESVESENPTKLKIFAENDS